MKELNFWQKLVRSLDTITKNAFSARKLTAWDIMLCVSVGHAIYYYHCYTKDDFTLYDTILIIDYIAVGFFLGLITIESIIELKNGKNTSTKETTTTETTIEKKSEDNGNSAS